MNAFPSISGQRSGTCVSRHLTAALAAGLLLAGSAFAYEDRWIGAGGDGNWATDANWESPSYPGSHFAPDAGSSVVIWDGTTTANVTLYSGGGTIKDFSAQANFGPGGNTSFTMKSGTTLHSTLNFDLGYFNGPETTTFIMEQGATLTVDGYFGGGHAAPHSSLIAGTINTNILAIGGGDLIHFSPTAVITANADSYTVGDITSNVNLYITNGLFTTDPGYSIVNSYDSNTQVNTISVVPEPAMGGLLLVGAAKLLRGCRRGRSA